MSFEMIAAVDLGSNSFRLQVGRVEDNQIYPLDSLKSTVRLAGGLSRDKHLDEDSQQRALAALALFGERLRGFEAGAVRVVATNSLRVAKNAADFIERAQKKLGFPIEVIAGREEARLIYIGASHSLPAVEHKRLVIDIGGGSTECIIGKRHLPQMMESLYMGCVGYSEAFFPEGRIDRKRLREARAAAAQELETIAHDFLRLGWVESTGSSGTARAIADVLELNGLNPNRESGITREGLDRLSGLLVKAGSAENSNLQGLRSDRMPVFPGGMAIMLAVFEALSISHMTYAEGALRLGVLYDLLGRFHDHDMRESTVEHFMRRYQVDVVQAERVRNTARAALMQLTDGQASQQDSLFLDWAARLHEIGISVAHNAYHKHGAYILTYADMPGFSKKDQVRLAALVLGHRGKLEKMLALPSADFDWRLLLCLRLATLLHRSRDDRILPEWRLRTQPRGYRLELPAEWLAENPWTAAALRDGVVYWQRIGMQFSVDAIRNKAASPA